MHAPAPSAATPAAIPPDVLFRTLLDHISQGILIADKDFRVLAFNERYVELFGFPPDMIRIGLGYEDILRYIATRPGHGARDPEAHVRERLAMIRGLREQLRTEHVRPDGTVIAIRRSPVPTGGFVNSYTDITRRWRAEQEAERTAALLQATLDNMADGVRVFDADMKLVAFNRRAFELLGYPDELARVGTSYEAFARHTRDSGNFTGESDTAAMEARLARARSGRKHARETVTQDGRTIRKQRNPMPGGGFVSNYTDITDLKRAEQALGERAAELQAAMEDLRRSNAELEQFAYVASHDLQEPLRMVGSYCQLLQRRYAGKLDADADEFIGYAVEGATRMRQLVQDLLAYSRVGTKGKPFEGVAMEEVFAHAVGNLAVAIEETGARITRDPLPEVRGDAVQLVQLLQNLIGNALKFRGEAAPEIHVGAGRDGDRWRFQVRDNGIGIDPQYLDRIFLIFQRLHTRDEYPGTGIGLAVCKKIVERHGGHLGVDSEPGRGSRFHFTLQGRPD